MKDEIIHTNPAATTVSETVVAAAPITKRISWGAIFAGLIVTLVTQLLLTTLGVAIGAATVNPQSEADPMAGLGIGAGIWFLVSSLISLFVGGCVAGRLAGIPRRADGGLHGVITWGTATLVTLLLLSTAVGGMLGGAFGALGRALQTGASNPQVTSQAQAELQQRGISLERITQQARELLPATGPSSEQARQAAAQVQQTHGAAAQDPQAAGKELTAALERMFSKGRQVEQQDREAVLNVLVSRYNMNRDEASRAVSQWEQQAQQTQGQTAQAEQQVRQTGEKVASGVSKAAFWSFLGLLLGAIAAYAGGAMGAPWAIDVVGRDVRGRVAAA